ncbi:unnamed protein product [Pedinophyceae sp. YPF-701]|nr:unnamed protein product [Pedinophyceae sp. YPF-701]
MAEAVAQTSDARASSLHHSTTRPSRNVSKTALYLAASAAVAKFVLPTLLHVIWKRNDFNGMSGVVSYSSCMIAASRAVESDAQQPLFHDPLAEAFAGRQAMRDKRARLRAEARAAGAARGDPPGRIAVRTRYLDDAVLEALGAATAESIGQGWAPLPPPSPAGAPKQVVNLGAGMDARPWRLALPAGVHWFEVDRGDVLDAKVRTLQAAGAQSGPTRTGRAAGAAAPAAPATRHPLMCVSWTPVRGDLGESSWTRTLQEAGFDPRAPTVWLLEGLTMYLDGQQIDTLFRDVRRISAPCSVVLATGVTAALGRRRDDAAGRRGRPAAGSRLMETWKWGHDDPASFLAPRGWRAVSVHELGAREASYGRVEPRAPPAEGERRRAVWYARAVAA